MRKTFFAIIVIAGVAIMFGKLSNKEKLVRNLLLENVEALAAGEGVAPGTRCIGSGNTTCPITGTKVYYVTEPYSLE